MFFLLYLIIPYFLNIEANYTGMDLGFFADIVEGEDIFVDTQEGRLRGKQRHYSDGPESEQYSDVDWYLGVPYAEPPIGSLRFKDPQPKKKWSGVRDALQFSKICPQRSQNRWFEKIENQAEDCLYLNVYSPVNRGSDLMAVMVYIHGGSYRVGTGAVFIGDVLAQEGVVVVTLNYRLALLGFLTSGTDHMTGNYGLLDQILALKWIKNNIYKFRGDPNRVTIFGNSAGGGSVGLLSVSPLSKGLFQQTIAQSGSALSYWACHNNSVEFEKVFRQVAKEAGCSQNYDQTGNSTGIHHFNDSRLDDKAVAQPTIESLIQCLRGVDWKLLISYEFEAKLPKLSSDSTDFKPVVDGKVLPKSPRELFSSSSSSYSESTFNRCSKEDVGGSSFHIKALMTGTVENELSRHVRGLFINRGFYDQDKTLDRSFDDGFDRRTFEKAIDHVMSRSFGYDELISRIVLSQYTNWSNCSDPYMNKYKYIEFLTDLVMLAPTAELAEYSSDADIPTFLFLLNFLDKNSRIHVDYNFHEQELSYLFGGPFTRRVVQEGSFSQIFTDQHRVTSSFLMKMWSNFAKYGTPMDNKSEPVPGVKNIAWKTYDRNHPYYMRIETDSVSLERDLKPHHVNLWNRVIPADISRINKIKSGTVLNEGNKFCLIGLIAGVVCAVCLLVLVVIFVVVIVKRNKRKNLG